MRVFPPLIPLAVILSAWGLSRFIPFWQEPTVVRIIGGAVALLGLAFMAWGIGYQFRRGADPNPFTDASVLVVDGPYKISRNPIYLADLLLQVGLGLSLGLEWALVLLPATGFLMWVLVIRHEERQLAAQFGPEYEAYRQSVRRWL